MTSFDNAATLLVTFFNVLRFLNLSISSSVFDLTKTNYLDIALTTLVAQLTS